MTGFPLLVVAFPARLAMVLGQPARNWKEVLKDQHLGVDWPGIILRTLASVLLCLATLGCPVIMTSVEAEILHEYKGPDMSDYLQLTDFYVEGPLDPRVGDLITVRFNLENFGQFPITFADKGVFAAARDPDDQDRSFGHVQKGSTIQPGQTVAFSDSFQADKPGNWRIWPSYQIWLTGGKETKEGPADWHVCVLQIGSIQRPDLTPTAITTLPAEPTVDQDVSVVITVLNIGDESSPSCEGTLSCADFATTLKVPQLGPNQETVISTVWHPDVEGWHELIFYVDSKQEIHESREDNNAVSKEVYVIGRPDLRVLSATFEPEMIKVGQSLTVTLRIGNDGSGPAGVSKAALLIDGALAVTFPTPTLSAKGRVDVAANWIPQREGNYSVTFMADFTNAVDESNEQNNALSRIIRVLPWGSPDLVAQAITWVPELVTAGRRAFLKPSISNLGEVASPPCTVEFRVNGAKLGSVDLPIIPAGMRLDQIAEITVAWTPSTPASYRVGFMVDVDGVVDELDETNNEIEVTVEVGPSDSDPPTVTIYYIPIRLGETLPTERDQVTFVARANDPSGIDFITIYVNGMAMTTSRNASSCNLTSGPYPRRSTVFYAAQAADKAGNVAITPWYNFTVRSYYAASPSLQMIIDPPQPTEIDEVTFTATASYPYGIRLLRIYLNGHRIREVSNATIVSIVRGPWPAGHTVSYYAEAYTVDDHHLTTPERSFTVRPLGRENVKNMSSYVDREVFVISDLDWRAVLSLVPISVWREMRPTEPVAVGTIYKFPVLIYHQEDQNAFDADAVIRFLQQYAEYGRNRLGMRVTILGDPPADLIRLMVAPTPVGAGIPESQIRVWSARSPRTADTTISLALPPLQTSGFTRALTGRWGISPRILGDGASGVMPMDDIFTAREERQLRDEYWSNIDVFVLSEDEYATALMASVYASLLNAPILFQGHYDMEELDHKSVYLVGRFSPEELADLDAGNVRVLSRFTLDDLRRHYVIATGTNGIILVNPLDLWTHRRFDYATDKASDVSFLFAKHSLAAPFLAAAKKEVIVSTTANSYPEIDAVVDEAMESLPLGGPLRYLTIVASPEVIPIARANLPYAPAMWGDDIYYQGARYIDVDIVRNSISGTREEYVTSNLRVQFQPACSDRVLAWTDENTWGDIWYQDLLTGRTYQLTGADENSSYMIGSCRPAVYGSRIVWQDGRSGNWDIYLHDASTNSTVQLTTSLSNQEWPAIWESYVVFQQEYANGWDIVLCDLDAMQTRRVTIDNYHQERPAIWGNKIVYGDTRDGDWDVRMAVLNSTGHVTSRDLIVASGPGDQMYPRIHERRIVWQDNSNGNWDIWLFDYATFRPEPITSEPVDQVLPNVWGDNIAWLENSEEGSWYVCVYNIPSRSTRRIARIEVSADSGPLWLELDGRFYGSTQNMGHQDIATGRIYGVTASDVSAYIARDLFYDRIGKNRDALVIVREDRQDEIGGGWADEAVLENYARNHYWTTDVEAQFSNVWFYSGHTEVHSNHATIQRHYQNAGLIIYVDHGLMQEFAGVIDSGTLCLMDMYLQPVTVLDLACLTGAYYVEVNLGQPPMVLSVQHIRRGAMAYMGATDVSYWHHMFDNILQAVYREGKSIGEAYLEARNEDYDDDVWNFSTTLRGDIYYALLGDPTFCPRWW